MENETITNQELFSDIDFKSILSDDNFKEDSVRELIILPILKRLGYEQENIIRSKTLQHPFLKIGSNKNIPIKLVPDYAIKIGAYYPFVLDAKSPSKNIINDSNVEQVYSYASHPEIRSDFFVLCNGIEIAIYRTTSTNVPVLHFHLSDIEEHWKELESILSFNSFSTNKDTTKDATSFSKIIVKQRQDFDYTNRPLLRELPVRKQAAKRHFGCNAYFTRQTWNVVQEYIKHYTQPGDLVLDPFGGSGITAIEALMINRKSIHVDLNPLSVFMVDSLSAPVNINELSDAFEKIKTEYLKKEPKTNEEIKKYLDKYKIPKKLELPLPPNSKIKTVKELFSDKQIAHLMLLKKSIKKEKNKNIQKSLFLAFYNTLSKCNLTFHKTPKGGGNHFGFYYNYRLAYDPTYLPVMEVFEKKIKRIINGKKEIEYYINADTIENIDIRKGTATDLNFIENESVDYIYTDPPYGKNIAYLDLSTMWNAWLDLDVTEDDYKLEAIEGGKNNKAKQEYSNLLAKSIREMFRVLKWNRWLSFVFAHKDPAFWHIIIDAAENCGFEYVGSVAQKNGQTSFKKRKHPFTILSGQLIINFRKVRNPKTLIKSNFGMSTYDSIMQSIEGIIAKNEGATIEQINNELVTKGMEMGFLHLLRKEYDDITPILTNNFDYDPITQKYQMRKSVRFTTHIPLEDRIRYYLISYLQGMERERMYPTFDEIITNIMPLLKNGTTPEKQTILNVLEQIGEQIEDDRWRFANGELF